MLEKTVVFALTANKDMALEVVNQLGLELGDVEVKHFADGEVMVETLQSVRGKNVYIIQSTCSPVTERLMEVLVFADGLKRGSAREINAVIPYYGYARQDRKAKAREPISAKLVADLLQVSGIHRVITMDLHAPQIQGFFDCPVDDLSAIPLFGRYFKKIINKDEEIVVVSPDHGGTTRARKLGTILNAPIAIIDKRRPKPNVAEVMGIIGDVKGKVAIMIDDIIDTGGTICAGAKALMDAGASRVYAACSHGIFSGDAIKKLQCSVFDEIVITNTIPLSEEKKISKIKVLSVAPMIAKAIEHIELGLPLSIVYDLYNI
ncbi:MAG: ribose-phosphate pyrophosphokinase [Erysipelotrichales bacterium]|nr:ribose-phosphate pyrophosphokinase [Bacilli bacterium]MEA4821394.1 ribose-phosphate pyrophosphokinase [Erysipelotrichales bacterium]